MKQIAEIFRSQVQLLGQVFQADRLGILPGNNRQSAANGWMQVFALAGPGVAFPAGAVGRTATLGGGLFNA